MSRVLVYAGKIGDVGHILAREVVPGDHRRALCGREIHYMDTQPPRSAKVCKACLAKEGKP